MERNKTTITEIVSTLRFLECFYWSPRAHNVVSHDKLFAGAHTECIYCDWHGFTANIYFRMILAFVLYEYCLFGGVSKVVYGDVISNRVLVECKLVSE